MGAQLLLIWNLTITGNDCHVEMGKLLLLAICEQNDQRFIVLLQGSIVFQNDKKRYQAVLHIKR